MVDLAFQLIFGTAYGALIFAVAMLIAIPYSVWRGLTWLWSAASRRVRWRRGNR